MTTARYMPQELFNLAVVAAAMAILARDSTEVKKAFAAYRNSYPSETVDMEQQASAGGVRVLELISDFPPDGLNAIERKFELLVILYRLLSEVAAQRPRPLWKRILGGTHFNYSPTPLPNRREDAIKACTKYLFVAIPEAMGRST